MNTTQTAPLPHQLIKPQEAAKVLQVSLKTLYTLTKRGDIAAVRIGKAVRYAHGELAAFVAKNTQAPGCSTTA